MKFGVCIPNYGETESTEAIRTVGQESEKLGYDSIWTTDHVLLPRNSETPYERIVDSIATLAYLAGQTNQIKLGISSLIVAMRNPAVLTKQLASIEELSGGSGRLLLAMAAGWNEKEFSFLGSNFRTRGKRLDETIRLVRALWRGDSEFDSPLLRIRFRDAVFEPKSASRQLQIWIGGSSDAAMRRACELGDAWHPIAIPLAGFREMVSRFRSVSPKAKDKPICVRIGLNTKANESEFVGAQGFRRILLSKNMNQNKEVIGELEGQGVTCAVLVPSSSGRVSLEDQIESLKIFAKEFSL